MDLPIAGAIVLPSAELTLSYSRSGGPGGQHVNTAETRVQLRYAMSTSEVLHPDVKQRLRERYPRAVVGEGDLLVAADASRSRQQNIEEARDRLAGMVRECLRPPKKRQATRPSRRAKARRVDTKKQRGEKKKLRGKVKW